MTGDKRFLATLITTVVIAAGASVASAAEYSVTSLGAAPISYIEHRFDINDSGEIAFTGLVAGETQAMYSASGAGSVDLHGAAIDADYMNSRAEAINNAGLIVGYTQRGPIVFREAALWTSGSASSYLRSLHTGLPGSPDISAAYDISDTAGPYRVVGYQRADFQSPSRAVIWSITGAGVVSGTEVVPLSSGMDYNIAYGVNDSGIVVGGEGVSGGGAPAGTAMFAFVYDSVSNVLTPVPGVQASDDFVTSVASAVSDNFVTGYALDENGVIRAFIHELGTSNTTVGYAIGPDGGSIGPRSLGFGIRESGGAPTIFGLSEVNGTLGSMAGMVFDRTGGNPQECNVNGSGSWSGDVTHVFAMNDTGQGIGLRSDGGVEAVFFEDVSTRDLSASLFMRDLEAPGSTDYYWGEIQDISGGTSGSVSLLFSNSPGCGTAFSCDGSADLSDEGAAETDFFYTGSSVFSGGSAATPQFTHDPTGYTYVQAISDDNNDCSVASVATLSLPNGNINPAGLDPWGEEWADCTGHINAETNISTSSLYCGGCGPSNNTDDGRVCTIDSCVDGSIQNTYNTNSAFCFIGGDCVPNASGDEDVAATNPSNDCEACRTSDDRYGWTDDDDDTPCSDVTDAYTCTTSLCDNGTCNPRAAFTGCQIGSSCYSFNQERPGNECQACRSSNPEVWTNDSNGTGCNTDSCYTSQTCTGGSCGGGTAVGDSLEPNNSIGGARYLGEWDEDDNIDIDSNFYSNGRNGETPTHSNLTLNPTSEVDWYRYRIRDRFCKGRDRNCVWCFCGDYYGTNCGYHSADEAATYDYEGGANENPQIYVAMEPQTSSDFETCVYAICTSGSNRTPSISAPYSTDGSLTSSSITVGGQNAPGYCMNLGAGAAERIEIHPDCPGNGNDTVDVYVRILDFNDTLDCNDRYRLRVGNELNSPNN